MFIVYLKCHGSPILAHSLRDVEEVYVPPPVIPLIDLVDDE